jgi:Transposase DDE domain
LVVSPICPSVHVSGDPRCRADARPRARRTRSEPNRRRHRQPIGQSSGSETRGYDAGKKIVARKRHIAVDTDGRLLMINLTPADISDSAGAQMTLDGIRKCWPWLKHLFADGGL